MKLWQRMGIQPRKDAPRLVPVRSGPRKAGERTHITYRVRRPQ